MNGETLDIMTVHVNFDVELYLYYSYLDAWNTRLKFGKFNGLF